MKADSRWSKSRAIVACALVMAASSLLAVTSKRASADSTSQEVVLAGEGSYDIDAELGGWTSTLYGDPKGNGVLGMGYTPAGTYQARQDFIAGTLDYVISGVPFSASEVTALKSTPSEGDLISAPIIPSAVGFLLNDQYGFGYLDAIGDRTEYTGPINVPYANLAAMALDDPTRDPSYPSANPAISYSEWDNPTIQATWNWSYDPAADFFDPVAAQPEPVMRSDPDATTYYLGEFVTTKAPAVWQDDANFFNNGEAFGPPTEELPTGITQTLTRQGLDTQLSQLVTGNSSFGGQAIGGLVADVPPSAMSLAVTAQKQYAEKQKLPQQTPPQWVQVQNEDGVWVSPTPASIEAAEAAGDLETTPLYPLTNSTKAATGTTAAYPLTYIDNLYAPAHGLSQEKTEGIATLIRYLVTDGQASLEPAGDGKLSAALVQQALKAANQLVDSNCTGSGEKIVTNSDPGPLAPSGAKGMAAIGDMDHCQAVAQTSSSTTTTPGNSSSTTISADNGLGGGGLSGDDGSSSDFASAPSGDSSESAGDDTGSSSVGGSGGAPSSGQGSSPARSSAAPGKGGNKESSSPNVITAAQVSTMPLPPGSGVGGLDPLGALGVGALLFLLLRKPITALVRAARR